jgi:hypothetical protein
MNILVGNADVGGEVFVGQAVRQTGFKGRTLDSGTNRYFTTDIWSVRSDELVCRSHIYVYLVVIGLISRVSKRYMFHLISFL